MRWERGHQSPSVDDRRGQGGGRGIGGAPISLLFWLVSRFGLPGVLIFVGIIVCMGFLNGGSGLLGSGGAPQTAASDEAASFVSFTLDDTQAAWSQELAARQVRYRPARMVLFTDSTATNCGYGAAASGPFYCPNDETVYIDLAFYDELAQRFGAPGDFALAYVIAHEVGHHVQHQTGQLSARPSEGAQGTSVQTELQADCYAGVWARSANSRGLIEPGDLEEGMRAAAAIGDDRIQAGTRGRVNPESWTHGSSAQRVAALRRGYDGGFEACAGSGA